MLHPKYIAVCLILAVWLPAAAVAQNHARLGSEAFEQGDFEQAAAQYRQAVADEPSFALYMNLGHSYMRIERWAEAAGAYEAAADIEPESATADLWRFLGQARYNSRQFEQAVAAFARAASIDPDRQYGIWIAQCMIEMQRWLQGRSVLLEHLQRHPADTEALELLAYVLNQQQDWNALTEVYRQLLTAAPHRAEYRLAMANVLMAQGRTRRAMLALEFARRVDKSLGEQADRLLADLYLAEDMPHEAAACYARLIASAEQPAADDYYRLGIAYFRNQEWNSAQDAFSKMAQIDPNSSAAELYLGHIAVELDDTEKARDHYQAAIRKTRDNVRAVLALGNLQMKAERYAAAAEYFHKAIDLGENQPLVFYNHILSLMRADLMSRLRAAVEAALIEHPDDADIQRLLDRFVEASTAESGGSVPADE